LPLPFVSLRWSYTSGGPPPPALCCRPKHRTPPSYLFGTQHVRAFVPRCTKVPVFCSLPTEKRQISPLCLSRGSAGDPAFFVGRASLFLSPFLCAFLQEHDRAVGTYPGGHGHLLFFKIKMVLTFWVPAPSAIAEPLFFSRRSESGFELFSTSRRSPGVFFLVLLLLII